MLFGWQQLMPVDTDSVPYLSDEVLVFLALKIVCMSHETLVYGNGIAISKLISTPYVF
jgi:hypothetical protein